MNPNLKAKTYCQIQQHLVICDGLCDLCSTERIYDGMQEALEAKVDAANKTLADACKDICNNTTEKCRFKDKLGDSPCWIAAVKKCLSQEPLLCDKSREPPCHLEPSKELCQKCELNKTSVANGDISREP